MDLKTRIQEDVKNAMRSGAKERLSTLRMISAAIKQREVDENIQLDDIQVMAVLEKMLKQRKESIAQFLAGGRNDLAEREGAEIALIREYLPEPLTETELDVLILQSIAETQASTLKDMGKAMAAIKQKAAGRADMATASARLKAKLSSN